MDKCPECEHEWTRHDKSEGCYVGWKYREDSQGALFSASQGCECRLAHVDESPNEIARESLEVIQ